MNKHHIQAECGERAGGRGTGRLNPSRETKFSGANGDRRKTFPLFSLPHAGYRQPYLIDPHLTLLKVLTMRT